MRYSILSFVPLSVAIVLVIAGISLGSPTNHDQYKRTVDEPAQLLDASNFHAATELAASDGANSDLRRKRDLPSPSKNPSALLLHRHNHIMDHLRLYAGNSSLDKRSLVGDLTIMGFKLFWNHADMIVSSSLAYYRTTEYYKNMTILAGGEFRFGPTVQNYVITYGCFRLTFSIFAGAAVGLAEEFAKLYPNGFGQFIQEFAEVMLLMAVVVIMVTYTILAYSVSLSIWITMVMVENANQPMLVSGP